MKKKLIVFWIVIVLILGLVFRNNVKSLFGKILYYSPCDYPIKYSIGSIDSRFNVTVDELINDSQIAADVWSNTVNKKLFEYDPKAKFTINMVYDARQKLTTQIDKMDTDLKKKQGELDPQISELKRKQETFEVRLKDLNSRISYWNNQGGAPKEEYDKLVAEQKTLQKEADELNSLARSLGQSAKEYNTNAQEFNKTINEYQEVLQETPEEGLYEQDGGERKISIYIDVSKDEFLHTLAHEFGHALNLSHTQNPKAVMYPKTSNYLVPQKEEIDELVNICKKRTIFEVAVNRYKAIFKYLKTKYNLN